MRLNSIVSIILFVAFVSVSTLAFGGGGTTTTQTTSTTATTLPTTTIETTTTTSTVEDHRTDTTLSPFTFNGKNLPCGVEESMRDRVRCRLAQHYEEDQGIYYVPEECRAQSPQGRAACFILYDSVQKCRDLETDATKMACVRTALGLTLGVSDEKKECQKLAPTARGECVSTLQNKAFSYVKFRLYNLEHKAEELQEAGVLSKLAVEDFIVKIEEKKLSFDTAQTIAEKKQVLKDAQTIWLQLKTQVLKTMGDAQ